MKPSRGVNLVAARRAGTMASSSGRAMAIPAPRRKVLLGRLFLVMNMAISSGLALWLRRLCPLYFPHQKWWAIDHAQNQRLHRITLRRGILHDLADGGRI